MIELIEYEGTKQGVVDLRGGYLKRRWIVAILLGGMMCFGGCSDEEKTLPEENAQQETDGESSDRKNTEVEPGIGEGVSSMVLDDLSGSEEYTVDDTIALTVEGQEYELQIDAAAYMEPPNQYIEDSGNVVVIDYTYRNLSENLLLIDDMSFQLTDSGQKEVYEPYFFNEQKVSDLIGKGESSSGQIAFSGMDEGESLTLVYTDHSSEEFVPILISLGEVKNK